MIFGKKIKELREEHGMVQRKLAAALDIDTPMYSKIERGERKAKRSHIPIMAKLLVYLLWPNYWKSTRKNY